MEVQSLYLKNLNALRAIAAYMVIVHHVEQFKTHFNIPNIWNNSIIRELGGNAVSIFFVLSGFLISYLLLQEKKKKKTIALKKFYFRRILRIWPLFFILLILGLITNYFFGDIILLKDNIIYFLFFIPNFLAAQSIIIPFIAHLWSIGVEEQFYIFWPLIAKKANRKQFFFSMCLIIILFFISRNLIFHLYGKNFFLKLLNYTRFDMMAMGGIGALVMVNTNKVVTNLKLLISKPIVQVAIISVFILYFFNLTSIYKIYFFENIFFGSLTTLLLLTLVNPNSILNLEFSFTKMLGDISYGVYMYHSIIIFLMLKGLILLNIHENALLFNLVLYPIVIILSSITAYLSYHLIELRFLKLKEKYVVVNSKPEK